MSDTAVIPAWVVVPPAEVADCHRIAHAIAVKTQDLTVAGVAATVNWVTGGQESPITGRELPGGSGPDVGVARVEMLAAGGPVPAEMWRHYGLEPRGPITDHPGWCRAVSSTLGWLLGVHTRPPFQLPRRNPDGSVLSGEQLYREAVAAHPHRSWIPEQRAEARDRAYELSAVYQRLAALADSVPE
jgi:hypothetical protein